MIPGSWLMPFHNKIFRCSGGSCKLSQYSKYYSSTLWHASKKVFSSNDILLFLLKISDMNFGLFSYRQDVFGACTFAMVCGILLSHGTVVNSKNGPARS